MIIRTSQASQAALMPRLRAITFWCNYNLIGYKIESAEVNPNTIAGKRDENRTLTKQVDYPPKRKDKNRV